MKEFNGTKTEEKIITNRQTERQREDGTEGQNAREGRKRSDRDSLIKLYLIKRQKDKHTKRQKILRREKDITQTYRKT